MANQYSIAEARDHLTSLIRDAERGASVEITRRGKPVAVLVSMSEYQKLRMGADGFWLAFERFLGEVDLDEAGLDSDIFDELRDRTAGREVNL